MFKKLLLPMVIGFCSFSVLAETLTKVDVSARYSKVAGQSLTVVDALVTDIQVYETENDTVNVIYK